MERQNNLPKLTAEQRKIARDKASKKLVLAGPGTGKTTLLLAMAVECLRSDDKRQVLFLSFSNRVAQEVRQRVADMPIDVMTIHALGYRLIKKNHKRLGYAKKPNVIDNEDNEQLIRKAFETEFKKKKLDADIRKQLLSFILEAIANNYKIDSRLRDTKLWPWREPLKRVKAVVKMSKRGTSVVSFDDQVTVLRQLLKDDDILSRIGQRYQAVLVDEFQDLNRTQVNIVCQLASVIDQAVVAGDDAQAIYNYRKNQVDGFQVFQDTFDEAKQFVLGQSHRCPEPTIKLANAIREEIRGVIPATLTSTKAGGMPRFLQCRNANCQDKFVVGIIERLVRWKKVRYEDITILGRRKQSIFECYRALCQAEIPALIGNQQMLEEICSGASLLIEVACGNIKKYGPLLASLGIDVEADIEEALSGGKLVKLKQLEYLLTHLKKLKATDNVEYQLKLVQGILQYYMSKDHKKHIPPHFARLQHLSRDCESLDQVLAVIAEYGEARTHQVSLQTIHASKGLEYKLVILIDMVDHLFPDTESISSKEERSRFNEERKLFYVAVSRSKQYLYMFGRPTNITITTKDKKQKLVTIKHCSLLTEEVLACCSFHQR